MAVHIVRNVPVPASATASMTGTVVEPSVSAAGNDVFFTGNWYAASSHNLGGAWTAVNPFTALPSADGGFCCDQTVVSAPSQHMFVWLLQYVKANGTNTLRLAVRDSAGIKWWWDFRPTTLNHSWTDQWFDYNSAALSDNYLYVTSNIYDFSSEPKWLRAVVIRVKLTDLAAGAGLPFDYFEATANGSLRCTFGATATMYFGSPNNDGTVRVFTWPESSIKVTQKDVAVAGWTAGTYSAPCPDGTEWLSRLDDRITAAWTANGTIGFAWSANKEATRPFPYVRIVRLTESTQALLDQPDIWSSNFAYAYPDIVPNHKGGVGITLFRGGGTMYPSHVVGVLATTGGASWTLRGTKNGTNGPADSKWGDYLTCRPHDGNPDQWVAAGFTLQGGGGRTNIEPRLVVFS